MSTRREKRPPQPARLFSLSSVAKKNGRRKRRNEDDDDDCTKTTQQQQKCDDSDCDVPRKDREGARRKERETPKANVRGRGAVEGVWYVQLSREGFLSFER